MPIRTAREDLFAALALASFSGSLLAARLEFADRFHGLRAGFWHEDDRATFESESGAEFPFEIFFVRGRKQFVAIDE